MKASQVTYTFIFLFLLACQSKQEKVALNLKQIKTICFSDSLKLDTFKMVTNGKNSDDLLLTFTITSHNGKEIFRQNIKAKDLLESYLASENLKKEAEKEKFIKEEVDYFLDDEHFLEPAITENEQPDKNTPDLAFYNELKKSKLNGFSYRLGKDKKYYIAWSIKQQKVKVYYQCC